MNIYKITWEYDEELNFIAVVVSISEEAAMKKLNINNNVASNINVSMLGRAVNEITEPRVVCLEAI